ncbi:hypothetical protein Tco_0047607 [Tanacetum coccineum]
MIDQDKIMVPTGGNIIRKTPQESYDLIENMTHHHFQWDAEYDSIAPGIDNGIYELKGDILFLEGLLNDEILSDLHSLELNNDPEGDILFLENLLKDEPLKANKLEINPLIREPSNTFLMGDEEIELNFHKDIDDLVPIPRVSRILLILFLKLSK